MLRSNRIKTRFGEYKRAVALFDHDSKISCHDHQMDFHVVNVAGHGPNFHKRLFLKEGSALWEINALFFFNRVYQLYDFNRNVLKVTSENSQRQTPYELSNKCTA